MFPAACLELELLSMEPGLPEQLSQTLGQGRRWGALMVGGQWLVPRGVDTESLSLNSLRLWGQRAQV